MVARKGWEAKCDMVTDMVTDIVTDTTGSWDVHASKKEESQLVVKVIGPEEMPILIWGRRKRPPTKMGST